SRTAARTKRGRGYQGTVGRGWTPPPTLRGPMTTVRDRKLCVAPLLAGVLAALVACGGGGAKATYIEAADAVCARSAARVKALSPAADAAGVINRLQQLS